MLLYPISVGQLYSVADEKVEDNAVSFGACAAVLETNTHTLKHLQVVK